VTFHNAGKVAHTVTARDGSFDATVGAGASATITFAHAGTFAYYCKFHPAMTGSVTVVGAAAAGDAPPAPAAVAAAAPVARASTAAPARPVRKGGVGAALADFRFAPAVLRVRIGQPVTWTNRGAAPHSVTALDGSFDSGVFAPGKSWTHVFRRKGRFRLVCSVHPQMRGLVIVAPRPRKKR
jgi:plastocyanin